MPNPSFSISQSLIFALHMLLALAADYDCNLSNNECSQGGESDQNGYSVCMVRQYSVSAFIQCASQEETPDFTAVDDDEATTDISALEILTNAASAPACGDCPLAQNIQKAANEHGSETFSTYLCDTYHPVNSGLCCLRNCLLSFPREHSINAVCSGKNSNLMNAPEQPESCGGDPNDGSSGAQSGDASAVASSSFQTYPIDSAINPTSAALQLSASLPASISPAAKASATPPSATNSAPTAQATSGASAAPGRLVNPVNLLVCVGLAGVTILVL